MVTKNSAERISNYVRDIDHLPSASDHRGLVRFDHSRDDRYVSVIETIKEIAARASQALPGSSRSRGLQSGHSYHTAQPVRFFVSRLGLEDQIKTRLHDSVALRGQSPKILMVHGLGGAGKSQLVLSYVRSFRRDYSSVFIIDASTRASVERDYQQIYRMLHDPRSVKPSETVSVDDAIDAVKSWFDGRDRICLLVFDSADNMHDSQAADFFSLHRYLPASPHLDVIITTRARPTPGLSELAPVEVAELGPNEAAQLFFCCSGTQDSDHEVTEEVSNIVEELGHLALAVTLAGAWVVATPHKSVKDYLPDYLARRSAFLRRKADSNAHNYEKSVFATWEMSYEAISEQCPAAANMLSFLAFIDNNDILLRLLNPAADAHTIVSTASDLNWQQTISPEIPLEDVVDGVFETLAKYSLVKWSEDTGSYSMHKLVHAWGHDRLTPDLRAKYGAAALECLATTRLRRDSDPTLRARLAPHSMANFRTMSGWYDVMGDSRESMLKRVALVADHLRHAGMYESMRDLKAFEYKKLKELLPADDRQVLRAANDLAVALRQIGRQTEAVKLHREVLEGKEKVLGKEHPNTLTSVNNLAVLLRQQGDYKTAEEMFRQALEGWEKMLGKEHPNTLLSVSNLAGLLRDQGDYKTAEELYRQALESMENVLGKEHPDTLTSINNLALVLRH